MKLLITGSSGFVAGSILAQAGVQWEVHGCGRTEAPGTMEGLYGSLPFYYHPVDLLDTESLSALLYSVRPDAVIHTAAIANIDFCEEHPAIAEAMNTSVTERLAAVCREINAKLVFCSTDTVFDGKKGFYTEVDPPSPINMYARTKVAAERAVLAASAKNVVARLSLVMGLPVMGRGNSFLAETLDKLKRGEAVKFPENETRTPIDVITLGAALHELAGNEFGGIIHLSGNTRINRYLMAREIAETTGFSPDLILPVNSNSLPGRTPRPDDVSLDNSRAGQVLNTPMRSLSEGLALTLSRDGRITGYLKK
jgi:dTDP-4-dehydrorhamnose reductase